MQAAGRSGRSGADRRGPSPLASRLAVAAGAADAHHGLRRRPELSERRPTHRARSGGCRRVSAGGRRGTLAFRDGRTL